METWDAITARRNVRAFASRTIGGDDLDRILEAGRRAPSALNWQPWEFIAITDRALLRELASVGTGTGHVADAAAAIAVVVPDFEDAKDRRRAQNDVGQAAMSMLITATDLGIGSGHAGVDDQERARQILGFPEDRIVALMVDFGYPADRPLSPIRNPKRRPFEEIVHRERW
jgi:nitroreductase